MLGFESLDFATKFVILAALVVGFVVLGWVIAPKKDKVKKIKTESELFEIINSSVIQCKVCHIIMYNGNREAHVKSKHKEFLK